jgi:hypothetical protein
LLLAGYEGMKQRLRLIPPPGQPCFSEAIERMAQPYEAMVMKGDAAR